MSAWKGADTSYLQNIRHACRQHPSLKLLKALPATPEHPSRIKILEFASDTKINDVEIDKLPQLKSYWSNAPSSSTCQGRLYIVENISLPWISALGSHFDIDPRFFAEYLKLDLDRTQNMLAGYHTMRHLPSLRPTATFSTFVYHEIRTFEGCAPRREEYQILTRDNIARLVTTVDHHSGRSTGLIRRALGLWWKPSGPNESWDAIILVDPGMSDMFHIRRWTAGESSPWQTTSCQNTPYLDGYLDFSHWPPPKNQLSNASDCVSYANILGDISYYWHHASPAEIQAALHDPREAFLFPYRILASHWNLQLEYLVSVISNLEKGLLQFEQMDAHPQSEKITAEVGALRVLLSDVNGWRRRAFFYLEQMRWNIENLNLPSMAGVSGDASSLCSGSTKDFRNHDDVSVKMARGIGTPTAASLALTDLYPVLSSLRLSQERIQSLLPVVMGAFSLLEAQHSVIKADLTIRLSSVGLVFVPLSFTASVLSMGGDFLPGRRLFWVYWAVNMPLIVGLFWWAYWVQAGRMKRAGMRAWKETIGKGRDVD